MKITIESYDKKYSIEMPNEIVFDDFMEEFKNLCKCLYSPDLIDEYFE